MPLHAGVVGGGNNLLPTITISSVTNYNQNLATFNATVNPNYATTSVKFQYSTNGSTWTDGNTVSGLTGGTSQGVYSNHTGLSVGTLYYVRAVATSPVGTSTSSSTTFTTWSLQTYIKTTSGSFSVSVPSVTPTGGSAIAPTIYEMLIYGGGGAAAYSGGGGGGYRIFSSYTSGTAGTQNITGTVGAGGTNPSTQTPAPAGENSTITVGSTTWTAGGGAGGRWLTDGAGAVGSGDNPAYTGGNGYYGYSYSCNPHNCNPYSCNPYACNCTKNGCDTCYETCYNTCYDTCVDYNRYSGGGGGGTDSGGGNASYPDVGGTGGAGGGAYGLRGGNGGGGGGTAGAGANGSFTVGSGTIVGTGGQGWWGSGVAGGVTFKYYGP